MNLAEKILTSRAALEGERKQVTVLFADLKGSMELLADRDPEEARKLLDPVIEQMMDAVHRYEGTVNQVMGDGIMALFGAPLAHEDHAVRACYAALRMQDSVRRYSEQLRRAQGVEAQIRIGLNSGEVVVRSIGSDLRMDYTAVGQTTHLAARMEQLATPGTVRLTGETVRLAEGYVEVRSLGPIPVKGLADPVEIFELTGAGQARTRLQAAALRGLTRFVGRDAEVEHLRRVLDRAAGGHGQVVSIVGEAGVGKSRLTYEFTHSHRVQDWLILEASSVSYGKATSYLPVIDLLKGYFKIGNRDDHRDMHAKVLGRVLSLDRALESLLSPLLALLDVPVEDGSWQALDPPQRRRRTLEAVRRLLLRESQVQPLLVVFEDLHWIDSETQALLDSLVDSLGSARLLLLVNYRPEYQHAWGSKTAYSQMRLDALSTQHAGELLDVLLGADPSLGPLKELLVRRGNPFFLEETVRTLVETKALEGLPGRYRLTQPLQSLQVPSSVQTILAARIDRLSSEDKRLLQTASVVGKDVPFALLQGIAELSDDMLRGALDRLQAAEFLYESSLFPDLEYTFKHALTHEVTYGSLLADRRRALHSAVVETMEGVYAGRLPEHAERLAHHALRGEVWDKAVTYFREAGAKAAVRSAYREAVTCFEQALAALPRLPRTHERLEAAIDLRFDLRTSLLPLGQLEKGLEYLREAEGLARTLDDPRRLAWASAYMISSCWLTGRLTDALTFAQTAQAIADTLGDLRLKVVANQYLAATLWNVGDYQAAMDLFRKVTESLKGDLSRERFGQALLPSVFARRYLAHALSERGEFDQSIAEAEEGLRIAEAADHPFSLGQAYLVLGYIHVVKGEFDQAVPLLERALAMSRDWNIRLLSPSCMGFLGYTYALSGRLAEGLALLADAMTAFESGVATVFHSLVAAHAGEACILAGRSQEAHRHAERALTLARRRGERGDEAYALRLLGEIHSQETPPDDGAAETRYRQAMTLADHLGMRLLVAHCQFGLGTLYRRTEKREQAQEHLTTATAMYREMGMTYWLEKAEAEIRDLA
ncbi:MAG TPA: adenylate/guanylate cyclase domain-containing protein [Verrucomicrobiae bacterium]|jgi:class 3 adenylate cyclase/tetratricopeptide (TPR) repeat protein|nr:adenylate/guanylate cyclase domain-containing protein [Verrucomicrobiae bacterium]